MVMQYYKSLLDLFHKWLSGTADLEPANKKWRYRVSSDRLQVLNKKGGAWELAAIPTEGKPRLFLYRISMWRRWIRDRTIMESRGGVPVMDFELEERIPDLCLDTSPGDGDVFRMVERWIRRLGDVGVPRETINWRNVIVGVDSAQKALLVAIRYAGTVHTRVVAKFEEGHFYLLGQARRSPAVNWLKDAVITSVSRAAGHHRLQSSFVIRKLWESSAPVKGDGGEAIPYTQTPSYLFPE